MSTPGLRPERLRESNFEDFSSFINCEDAGCYCSFWHQKWASMAEWDQRKAAEPGKNRACMLERVRANFHLGVLMYRGDELAAWVSVGPLPDFHWTWRRVAQLGEASRHVAGIPCITRRTEVRDSLSEASLLEALKDYGRGQGWRAIEGYPFDRAAIDRHGDAVTWAGYPEEFELAGYRRVGEHWLSSPEAPRSICRFELGT